MATVTFENGQSVEFDGTPTPQDIEEVAQKLKIQKATSVQQNLSIPQSTLTGPDNPVGSLPVIKQATQFGSGVGSALGKAALNIPKAFLSASQGVAKMIGSKADYSPAINAIDSFSNNLFQKPLETELDSGLGKTGEIVGSVAPYFAGGIGSGTSKLVNGVTEASQGFKPIPILGKILSNPVARTAVGATTEGAANYGAGYALSGGDTQQAKNQALFAGGLKGLFGGIGEVANATKFPQRLMANIYKTDKKTVSNIFNNIDNATVANGSKKPIQKLSDWALSNDISGSLETQAHQVQKILKSSEEQVIKSAEAAKKRITVEPNLFKLAQKIVEDFQDVGRGEIAQKADQFLRAVKDNQVNVKDAILFKRLLTNTLQTKSSFNNPTLSDNLAYWAEDLTKTINSIDDIGTINKDYSQAMKAREALIKAATSAENRKALGALEAYAIGGGIATGFSIPALLTVGAKRAAQSPRITSKTAKVLKNLPQSSARGSATRSIISRGLSDLMNQ